MWVKGLNAMTVMQENLKLPEAFLARMESELGSEYEAFLKSYAEERAYGLRANPLKADLNRFTELMPFTLEPVPWAEEGFYYNEADHPGRHVLHEAGAYYIQEPSAMSAAAALSPEPGDRVLDLCAAPGGKSTQIAGRLRGEGLLVANEIVPDRARILSQNIERLGVRNAVVTNESPENLRDRFTGFFDKILVDAPCSGEGMFRKDENAALEWSEENVKLCAERQAGILDCAAEMLRPGGVMVYSTCTFSKAENELNVEAFLKRHGDFSLESAERFWPHRVKGEGHFVARLKRTEDGNGERYAGESPERAVMPAKSLKKAGKKGVSGGKGTSGGSTRQKGEAELKEFLVNEVGLLREAADKLFENADINYFGENVYLTPKSFGSLSGLSVVRPGLHIAVDLGNRLEPAHALSMSLRPFEVSKRCGLSPDEAFKYQCGESIPCDMSLKGWCTVFTEGFSTGFGKASGGTLKNHYPKGLRIKI